METIQHVPGLLSHVVSFLETRPHSNYVELCQLQVVSKSFRTAVVNLPGFLTRVHLKLRNMGHDMLGVVDASQGKLVELTLGEAWSQTTGNHLFTDRHLEYLTTYTPLLGFLRLHLNTRFTTKGLESLNRLPSLTHVEMPMGNVRWPSLQHVTWMSVFGNVTPASVTHHFTRSAVSKRVTNLCINRLRRVTAQNIDTFARVFPNIQCLRMIDCSTIRSYDPLVFKSDAVLAWVRNLTAFSTIQSDILPITYTAFSRTYARVFPNVSHFGTDDPVMSPVEPCPLCKSTRMTAPPRLIVRRCVDCLGTSLPVLRFIILFK